MATFTVKIDTGNDAFADYPTPELVRILRDIARRMEEGDTYDTFRTILDANGNDVGRFALKEDWYNREGGL
jgi:hypothetical protein